jgi:hypothetical protein
MPKTERQNAILIAFIGFAILGLISVGILGFAAFLGQVELKIFSSPIQWLRELETDTAFEILSNSAELVAGILSIAITVVAIVVELAATRYSHRITKLFISEPLNVAVMSLFLLTTVQCLWMAVTVSEPVGAGILPNAGFGISILMVMLSLLVLLPYFYFVFSFISPLSIIQKLGFIAHDSYRDAHRKPAIAMHAKALEAIDEIQDIARSAADTGDTRIAMAAIETLTELALNYTAEKVSLPEPWFEIDKVIKYDPDFISLAPGALKEVHDTRTWFEVKIMRQFLALMNQTVPDSREIANMIAINSKQIGDFAASSDPALLSLIVRCFNSYLRTTIRAADWRTAYFIINQYRLLAIELLKQKSFAEVSEIVEHLRSYATFAFSQGDAFLLEVAAYDIVTLIEEAVIQDSPIVDDLLERLLELDQEIRVENEEASLLNVRRAQLQLATFFLQHNDEVRAHRIIDDMKDELPERLEGIRTNLMTEERAQYWEFTDRGVNFGYLAPERRPYLDTLFGWLREASGKG